MTDYGKKVDANHKQIVDGLKAAGREVLDLSGVGRGTPDILVSDKSDMWLLEIKSEAGDLNKRQRDWHSSWRGKEPIVVRSLKEAIRATAPGLRERYGRLVAKKLLALILEAERREAVHKRRVKKITKGDG